MVEDNSWNQDKRRFDLKYDVGCFFLSDKIAHAIMDVYLNFETHYFANILGWIWILISILAMFEE